MNLFLSVGNHHRGRLLYMKLLLELFHLLFYLYLYFSKAVFAVPNNYLHRKSWYICTSYWSDNILHLKRDNWDLKLLSRCNLFSRIYLLYQRGKVFYPGSLTLQPWVWFLRKFGSTLYAYEHFYCCTCDRALSGYFYLHPFKPFLMVSIFSISVFLP